MEGMKKIDFKGLIYFVCLGCNRKKDYSIDSISRSILVYFGLLQQSHNFIFNYKERCITISDGVCSHTFYEDSSCFSDEFIVALKVEQSY